MGGMKFTPKYFNLKQIVDENLDLLEAKLQSKNIGVRVDIPATLEVFADEDMITTVIRNLLTNATKFTRDKGCIKASTSTNTHFCYLSIHDNGIGIAPNNIDKLFRVDSNFSAKGTHNEKGSGLGLILSKEFIERCGGTIKASSEWGIGSTFTVSIPLHNSSNNNIH